MHYDPVKDLIRKGIRRSSALRKVFYRLLGLFFLREWYVKRQIRRLKYGQKPPLSILDAGSGFGQYTWYCARHFPDADILGIELDRIHVEDCRDFAGASGYDGVRYESMDLLEMQETDRYDLILCIDVLEHIENDVTLMKNLHRALRAGGDVIITSPSLDRLHSEDSDFVGEHVREGYSREEITRKLKAAGFGDVHVGLMYGPWGDLAWRFSIRNTMRLAGRSAAGKAAGVFYFALVFPFAFIGMIMDFYGRKKRGTGLIVTAGKQ